MQPGGQRKSACAAEGSAAKIDQKETERKGIRSQSKAETKNQTVQTMMAAGGSITPLMMWATPLLARLSAPVTCFKLLRSAPTNTPWWLLITSRCLPSTVDTRWYAFKSVDRTCSGSTWKVRMSASCALFSSFNKESNVPAGRAPKASLVGANTVNGPGEDNVSAKSAATTAVTRVERSSTDFANSTMLGFSDSESPQPVATTDLISRWTSPSTPSAHTDMVCM